MTASLNAAAIKAAHKALKRQIEEEEKALRRGAVRALNKSARTGRTAASREVRKTLNVRAGEVNRLITIRKATPKQLEAGVRAKYKQVPVIAFSGVRQTRKGVTVRMRKDKPRMLFKGAFITRLRTDISDSRKNVYRRHPDPWLWTKGRPETSSPNLPLKVLYGPTVFKVFGENIEVLTVTANAVLAKNLEHELDFALKQSLKGKAR